MSGSFVSRAFRWGWKWCGNMDMLIFNVRVYLSINWPTIYILRLIYVPAMFTCILNTLYMYLWPPLCFHLNCICVSVYIVFVFLLYLCFHLYCTYVFVAASISTACVCYLLTNAPLCNILLSILPLHTLTYLFLVLTSKYPPLPPHCAQIFLWPHRDSVPYFCGEEIGEM